MQKTYFLGYCLQLQQIPNIAPSDKSNRASRAKCERQNKRKEELTLCITTEQKRQEIKVLTHCSNTSPSRVPKEFLQTQFQADWIETLNIHSVRRTLPSLDRHQISRLLRVEGFTEDGLSVRLKMIESTE